MYLDELRDQVSQGDIFTNVPVAHLSRASMEAPLGPAMRSILAMLISHSCEFDKPNNRLALVAEVIPLANENLSNQGNIRKNLTIPALYLPGIDLVFAESFVSFRHIFLVPKQYLSAGAGSGNRIVSLDDNAVRNLWQALGLFFGPRKADNVRE